MRKYTLSYLFITLILVTGCRASNADAQAESAAIGDATPVVANEDDAVPTVVVMTATPTPAIEESIAVAPAEDEASSIPATSTPVTVVKSEAHADTTLASEDATLQSDSEPLALHGIMPDRISLPSINLDTPVVELSWHNVEASDGRIFSEWEVADQAAGWHKNSSLLGEGGNIVLSGHNNILGAVFRELDQLKRGDEALLWQDGSLHRYLVDKVMIVPEKYATQEQRQTNAAWIGHFEDDRLTLVSCWPRDDNSHRIIVVAYAEDSQELVSN